MKKIIAALMIAGLAYCGAQAQEIKQVCRKSTKGNLSCYKTKYAENFPVCKDDFGYRICGETRTQYNSTHSSVPMAAAERPMTFYGYYGFEPEQMAETQSENPTPQSQSFPRYEENATVPYGASYDEQRGKIKSSCYFGDNVAELNRNPYKGCPAPANDGTDATKRRAWIHGE